MVPSRVPITAISAATIITAAPSTTPAMNLAITTRERRGSSVKVTRPVRWLALGGHQHDDQDRQEGPEHGAGDAEEVDVVLLAVGRDERVDGHHDEASGR